MTNPKFILLKSWYLCFLFGLSSFSAFSQLVINELDSDTPGFDDQEFIELRSETPFFPLDGYVVVLFNGSENGMDSSYFSIDLNGYETNVNGLFLIGSNGVSPAPQYFIAPNTIQNGPDAVAIYQMDASRFEEPVLATTEDLIDALAYDTDDPDDLVLLQLLGLEEQINENENNNQENESIQRNDDGTYTVGPPTPRQTNDGSGVAQVGINFELEADEFREGDQFFIRFVTEEPMSQATHFSIKLDNDTFTETDYSGNTQLELAAGADSVSTRIQLIADNLDEGDEEMLIRFDSLPSTLLPLRDRALVRVIDNNYGVSAWGTPLEPTYDQVTSSAPGGYYESLNGKAGQELRQAITDLIANSEEVRAQTYADVIDILKEADQNPLNNNEVWMLYTEKPRAKLDFQLTSDSFNKWNREHVFPRSRGGFYNIKDDEIADGPDRYTVTNADSIRHGNTDAHALRAADARENSRRGNQNYGSYTGPAETAGSFYGDVARSAFFIALRYNGLEVINGFPEAGRESLGDLETLLRWHEVDPPDDFEMNRNNVVYEWQYNRNPFIDYPELADYIWGTKQGETWNQNLSLKTHEHASIEVFPNPARNGFFLKGFDGKKPVAIYTSQGKMILKEMVSAGRFIPFNEPSGLYLIELNLSTGRILQKLLIK